jgi:regulator of replication initiation timing
LSNLLEAGLRPSGQRGADLLKNVDDVKTLRSRLDEATARNQELKYELETLRRQYAEAERAADVRGAALAAQAEAYLSVIKATARAETATEVPEIPLERAA